MWRAPELDGATSIAADDRWECGIVAGRVRWGSLETQAPAHLAPEVARATSAGRRIGRDVLARRVQSRARHVGSPHSPDYEADAAAIHVGARVASARLLAELERR